MPCRFAAFALGTRVELVLDGPGAERDLGAAGEAALAEVEAAERRLSRFRPEGLPARLARARGAFAAVDADDWALLEEAERAGRLTGGAFDATLGSGRLLLDRARRRAALEPGAGLDLGGIGKGHALDLAARVLREAGIDCALLQAGTSSVVSIGAPPGLAGWRVRLGGDDQGPWVELCDLALSFSRAVRADGRAHVVDPRSGRSVARPGWSAALHRLGSRAEAWSTAALVSDELPDDADGGGLLCSWSPPRGPLASRFHRVQPAGEALAAAHQESA